MKKIKAIVSPDGVKFLGDNQDPMWYLEANRLRPWLYGKGADIGCGMRSVLNDSIRVDCDEKVKPQILAFGDQLPFKDDELDYITSIHSFEHFEDQYKTLKEWLRVLKPGGIVGIVHPDIDYTKKQNPAIDAPGLKENPYNRHYHENNFESLKNEIEKWIDLPFKIIDCGPACPNWSFYLIIQKK